LKVTQGHLIAQLVATVEQYKVFNINCGIKWHCSTNDA